MLTLVCGVCIVTLGVLIWLGDHMAGELDRLQTEVGEIGDVVDSAVVLIKGISQQLKDAIAANNPAALTALADQLDKKAGDLAAAVVENTEPKV